MPRQPRTLGESDFPLRDQVRDELRDQIIKGSLTPGQRLIEQTLADEFGVSRIPVREAIRMLQSEGLVETVPRRGVIVSTLSRDDLEHIFDVREALDSLAFRLAAERGTSRDLRRLKMALDASHEAMDADIPGQVTSTHIDYHDEVIRMAGNPFLSAMLIPIASRLKVLIGRSHDYERQLDEHTVLYQALAEHDQERAAALAGAHARTSKSQALAQFDREQTEHSA